MEAVAEKLQENLRELNFVYVAVYGYLGYLEKRFQKYEALLKDLPDILRQQNEYTLMLESELEETVSKIDFINLEMESLAEMGETPLFHSATNTPAAPALQAEKLSQVNLLLVELQTQLETLGQGLASYETTLTDLEQDFETVLTQNSAERSEKSLEAQLLFEDKLENLNEILETTASKTQVFEAELTASQAEIEKLQAEILKLQKENQGLKVKNQELTQSLATQEKQFKQQWAELEENQLKTQIEQEKLGQVVQALEAAVTQKSEDQQNLQIELEAARSEYEWLRSQWPPLQYQILLEFLAIMKQLPDKIGRLKAHMAQKLKIDPQSEKQIEERLLTGQTLISQHILTWISEQPQAKAIPAAQPLPTTVSADNMVLIPADTYYLGDDLHTGERPKHEVSLAAFYLDLYPVTNAQFQDFMSAEGYQNPDYWPPEGWSFIRERKIESPEYWNRLNHHCGPNFPNYPVVGISWYEALAYAAWAGKRLPTEAEWEAAARGPEGFFWPWGNEWEPHRANTHEERNLNTTEVSAYPRGASPFGCLDLVGNTFEWTSSLYRPYPYDAADGRENIRSLQQRVLRGCSWSYKGKFFTRAAYRFFNLPGTRHSDIGFRCAKDC